MLLVDIRSTLPSLQEKLNSPEYPATSSRIAESYDVISNFISYLIQSLDEDSTSPGSQSISFEPSQLLQLRTDIAETMSLTIEHLRDRYDASVAGAAGLHPSARVDPNPLSSNPRTIAWESASTSMSEDPLSLSELRTLALWLREDDNDALRREAAGILDVLLGIYKSEAQGSNIRSAVLTALEGIFEVPEGIEGFLREEGWEILVKDLQNILSVCRSEDEDRGLDVVRALLTVAESEVVGPAKQEWIQVVDLAVEALKGKPCYFISKFQALQIDRSMRDFSRHEHLVYLLTIELRWQAPKQQITGPASCHMSTGRRSFDEITQRNKEEASLQSSEAVADREIQTAWVR